MSIQIIHGDCRAILPTLAAGSVQCVVTSPPYFGLRDYGTATWDGGNPACDHKHGRDNTSHAGEVGSRNEDGNAFRNSSRYVSQGNAPSRQCKCGATRVDAQIGLEASPDLFIAEMVAVFREVWRVLRDDGTLWLNLGDSYAANYAGNHIPSGISQNTSKRLLADPSIYMVKTKDFGGAKRKDLLMMPARVAIALQADGWYLRSDIIWAKPNPMPESVTDRPTTAHEHVFLLTKQPKYFYDADAVREEVTGNAHAQGGGIGVKADVPGSGNRANYSAKAAMHNATKADLPSSRNLRNVWTIATHAYPDAHFATFPPKLSECCIKAGSKPGDTILDPFSGAGTVALVADRLGRRAIGIELNPEYAALARNRVIDDAPLFAEVS